MHKLEIQDPSFREVPMYEMRVGEIGVLLANDPGYRGTILRTFASFVTLENPSQTWTNAHPSFVVRILPKGAVLTLTVGEPC